MTDIKEMGFKEIWKDLPARISRFIWKLFSVKIAIWIGSFLIVYSGKITGWEAVVFLSVISLIVIFDRDAIKFIEALKGLK